LILYHNWQLQTAELVGLLAKKGYLVTTFWRIQFYAAYTHFLLTIAGRHLFARFKFAYKYVGFAGRAAYWSTLQGRWPRAREEATGCHGRGMWRTRWQKGEEFLPIPNCRRNWGWPEIPKPSFGPKWAGDGSDLPVNNGRCLKDCSRNCANRDRCFGPNRSSVCCHHCMLRTRMKILL
jgi:hypothetical protein